jgi:hypothetical protein
MDVTDALEKLQGQEIIKFLNNLVLIASSSDRSEIPERAETQQYRLHKQAQRPRRIWSKQPLLRESRNAAETQRKQAQQPRRIRTNQPLLRDAAETQQKQAQRPRRIWSNQPLIRSNSLILFLSHPELAPNETGPAETLQQLLSTIKRSSIKKNANLLPLFPLVGLRTLA